ncbi:MAG: 4-alpha-glucanotransferase [Verrucomicrobiaceae bacterium]|jgi:4-alpha-glucanotransferase|nr:4-alpha-glucanotransferase [Verrucomicrobiaceae bacterium]
MTSKRSAGLLAPVFALRHDHDLGVGDTRALRELMDWAAEHGIGFVQLLPINETGPDNSPYNAISSVALDPVLLEISLYTLPELAPADITAAKAGEDFSGDLVNFPTARRVKTKLLQLAFSRFGKNKTRAKAFATFCKAEAAWLKDYAIFRTLIDKHGHEMWDQWPADARASVDPEGPEATYHAWVQWIAFTQWRELRNYGTKIGVRLMGDIPIGVNYYSADVFANPHLFNLGWSGGAPPEKIFKDDLFVQKWGQNWGIPLYRWDVMEQDDFAWWRQRIAKLTDVFHIFRIDHVLGFYRIYGFPWRPQRNAEFLPLTEDEAKARTGGHLPHFIEHDDDTPEHCAANRAAGDKYLRMIQAAAQGAEVVGEDLGAVPDYVRPHLLERGIPGFKVPQWEVTPDDKAISGLTYDECSFTTYATHDHPPMAAIWDGCRHNMHHAPEYEDRMKAGRELRLLAEFAGIPPTSDYPPYSDTIKWQLMRGLLASASRYAAIMITDLFSMTDRFNVPGVVSDANWRTRFPHTAQQMREKPELNAEAVKFRELAKETKRA